MKAQPFFKDIKWDLLRNLDPPMFPTEEIVSSDLPRQLAEVFAEAEAEERRKLEEEV